MKQKVNPLFTGTYAHYVCSQKQKGRNKPEEQEGGE